MYARPTLLVIFIIPASSKSLAPKSAVVAPLEHNAGNQLNSWPGTNAFVFSIFPLPSNPKPVPSFTCIAPVPPIPLSYFKPAPVSITVYIKYPSAIADGTNVIPLLSGAGLDWNVLL